MNGAESGAKRFMKEFITGIALSACMEIVKQTFSSTMPGSQGLVTLVQLSIGIVGSLTLIHIMQFWGTYYLAGWFLSAYLLYLVGVLRLNDPFDLLVYFLVPVIILIDRIARKVSE